VPVVIAGHIHGYEHLVIDDVHYVITAGGGGPRGWLAAGGPNDVYPGPDCARDELGLIQRPFNYLLIERGRASLAVTMRGFCFTDDRPEVLESFEISLP
jgi:hypothetical protein